MLQRIVLILSVLALAPAPALAKSAQARVEKLLAKYVVTEADLAAGKFKPKVACTCGTAGSGDAFPGFLYQYIDGKVGCAVGISYDAEGEIQTFSTCGDFEVLSR